MTNIRTINRRATLAAGAVALAALAVGAGQFEKDPVKERAPGASDHEHTTPSVSSVLTQGRSYPAVGCEALDEDWPIRRDWDGSVKSARMNGVTWVLCPILLDMPDSNSLYVNVDMSGGWDRPGLGCFVHRTQFTWNGIDHSSAMFAKRNIPNSNDYSDDIWDANADETASWSDSIVVSGGNDTDTRAVLLCALDRPETEHTTRSSLNGYYVEERKIMGTLGGG